MRRIRESQEEERRRKLEELKQHVSFFTGFLIIALPCQSVNQSIFLLKFVLIGFVKQRQIPSFDNLFAWQAQQAQKFREQQEELRRRHIDELRSKDMDRRAQVCQFSERRF